jgi:hypothetical protein
MPLSIKFTFPYNAVIALSIVVSPHTLGLVSL